MMKRNYRGRVDYPCGPDCPHRCPGCQDHCPDMIKAHEKNERLRAQERRQRAQNTACRSAIVKACTGGKRHQH